jgi:hypothetical protein
MDQALKFFDMIFVADNRTVKVEQPRKEPLDFPAVWKS